MRRNLLDLSIIDSIILVGIPSSASKIVTSWRPGRAVVAARCAVGLSIEERNSIIYARIVDEWRVCCRTFCGARGLDV